jgi:uncharacterized protein YdbL (DUF1318 family)
MRYLTVVLAIVFLFGCAKVNLQTSKPIKLDINMRVDVYQHVVNDAVSIEDQIYGQVGTQKSGKQLNSLWGISEVYAADLSAQLPAAIEGRKTRMSKVEEYFAKGYVGENQYADLAVIAKDLTGDELSAVEAIVTAENNDRAIIYKATAEKNNASLEETRKIFFKEHYKRGLSGYWFELSDSNGKVSWAVK